MRGTLVIGLLVCRIRDTVEALRQQDRIAQLIQRQLIQRQSALRQWMGTAGLAVSDELMMRCDRVCRMALLTLCFVVPIQPLLPLKTYRLVEAGLLAMGALTLALHGTVRLPLSIRWSFWIGLAGWLVSTGFSSRPWLSIDVGILEFFGLYVVLYLAVVHLRRRPDFVAASILFALGVAIVAAIQTWTIIEVARSNFRALGVPSELPFIAQQFLHYKAAVPLFFPAGVPNTYGNIDNYNSLWVMLIPWLLGLLYVSPRRWLIAALLVVHLYAGLVVYSRGGVIAVAVSVAILWLLHLRASGRLSPAICAVLLLLIGLHIDRTTGSRFADGLISFGDIIAEHAAREADAPPAETEAGRAGSFTVRGAGRGEAGLDDKPSEVPGVQGPSMIPLVPSIGKTPAGGSGDNPDENVPDQSGADRAKALLTGISIAIRHLFLGIGYGMYPIEDPVLMSPHSLAILRFAEGGLLSLISFAMLAAYAPARVYQMMRTGEADMLSAACLCAVLSFMVKAALFGASFAISSNIVWAFAIALCLAACFPRTPVSA